MAKGSEECLGLIWLITDAFVLFCCQWYFEQSSQYTQLLLFDATKPQQLIHHHQVKYSSIAVYFSQQWHLLCTELWWTVHIVDVN
jgi:hypothetical protein